MSIPWQCPACGIRIRHSDLEPEPRRNVRYRCHICRLELVFDARTGKLIVAPLDNDHD